MYSSTIIQACEAQILRKMQREIPVPLSVRCPCGADLLLTPRGMEAGLLHAAIPGNGNTVCDEFLFDRPVLEQLLRALTKEGLSHE